MTKTRHPAVADMFYPREPTSLHRMIHSFLGVASSSAPIPKAIIAPHAGYIYSGPVAGSAYARLAPGRDRIKRVVLLGPTHRVAFAGVAVSSADEFSTPLGKIPLDRKAISRILDLPQVQILDEAHSEEHCLEVHLPFLQEVLGSFSIVPLVVGDASPPEVSQVLERLWGGPETVFVISSDLSHYHNYESARRLDQQTSAAIEKLQPENIGTDQACGRIPINGLLISARVHGLKATTVDLRNSGDTAGPRDRVVGYGAYVFEP